jgi:hypothetical protein
MRVVGEKCSINNVVKMMTNDYAGCNRILHMDNFYNSIKLSMDLLNSKYIQMELFEQIMECLFKCRKKVQKHMILTRRQSKTFLL